MEFPLDDPRLRGGREPEEMEPLWRLALLEYRNKLPQTTHACNQHKIRALNIPASPKTHQTLTPPPSLRFRTHPLALEIQRWQRHIRQKSRIIRQHQLFWLRLPRIPIQLRASALEHGTHSRLGRDCIVEDVGALLGVDACYAVPVYVSDNG